MELQRTKEWFDARKGCVSASILYDCIARQRSNKSKYYASREAMLNKLALETICDFDEEEINTRSLERGRELEAEAKSFFEMVTMYDIEEVGFIRHDTIDDFGASPDGLILGSQGNYIGNGIEIKCPNKETHAKTIIQSHIDEAYIYQMQAQMMTMNYNKWTFASYDNRFPSNLKLWLIPQILDKELVDYIKKEVPIFNEEKYRLIDDLLKKQNLMEF